MFESFKDAVKLPDLKRRFLFLLGALFIYRLGALIPTPGIDTAALAHLFNNGDNAASGVLGFLDLFAGGALSRFGIFALGVTPYINSSIVMQLLAVVIPSLERMTKEPEGQKKIVQYTRTGTIIFAVVQALGLTGWLKSVGIFNGNLIDVCVVTLTLTTGALAVMWLGELMSDHGIGNGISMLIFAGIVARIPDAFGRTLQLLKEGGLSFLAVIFAVIFMLAVVAGCILLQEGQRRLPVQYAKRVVGNKMYGGQSTFIPLRVNTASVIPIIFASSILLFPYTIAGFFNGPVAQNVVKWFSPTHPVYIVLFVLLIIFFGFFYTAVVFKPEDIAENMKKNGGFILGIRPGKPTEAYIEKIMERITLAGSVALAIIAVVPTFMASFINSFYFGGTAVIIVVGVALDTVHEIEAQLLMRHYQGILKRQNTKSGGLLRL